MIRKKSISCLPCTKQTWRPWTQILLQSPKRGSRVWLHIQSRKPCVPKYGMWLTCALHCNYGEINIEMLDTYVNPNYEEVLHSESNHTFKLWHEYITFILDIFFVILQPKCINDFFLFQLPMLTSYNSQLHIRWIQHLHNARERDHTWSITIHQPCSGKRKTVPKTKASACQKWERRPQEFSGVVKGKRGASSAVCSQCKIIPFQVCNIFCPEMCSTKSNPSCVPSRHK